MAYQGSVQLISGIIPQNGGNFKLVNAADVYVADNESLAQRLSSLDPSNYVSVTALENYYTKAQVEDKIAQSITGDGTINLDAYAPINSPNFEGNPTAPTQAAGNNSTRIATTAFVNTGITNALFTYAPKASPAFTGNPTAPTQAAGNNSTRIATTAFVNTGITNALSGYLTSEAAASIYAPKASPAFTGNPTAPTQAAGNNSTRIATTAFVNTGITNALSEYLTSTSAAGTYLTQVDAASTYLTQTVASSTYAPLASPKFTGNPTATTQGEGNRSTRLATTAYVMRGIDTAMSNLAKKVSITLPTGSTSYSYSDAWVTANTDCISHSLAESGITSAVSWEFVTGAVQFTIETELETTATFDFCMINIPSGGA